MSLIGEAVIGSPLLQGALAASPETTLVIEAIRHVGGETRLVLWATGGDTAAFEAGLDDDETIASYRRLTELSERRLYRVTLSAYGEETATYAAAFAEDIVIIEHRATDDGMWVRARLPNREALAAYRDVCREKDVPFELVRLYRVDDSATIDEDRTFGVTPAQREALLHALDAGYFDVPRGTDLQTMAADLGISPQALSTRLRRGQTNLVRYTLSDDPI